MSIDEFVKKMYYLCISLVMSMVVIIELFRYILSESVARFSCLLHTTKTFCLEAVEIQNHSKLWTLHDLLASLDITNERFIKIEKLFISIYQNRWCIRKLGSLFMVYLMNGHTCCLGKVEIPFRPDDDAVKRINVLFWFMA